MSIMFNIFAAFGGGAFAAAIGGVPSFIFTGILTIAGCACAMAGASEASDVLLNYLAFGSFFGPHISFTAAAAASGYAKKRGYSKNGADLNTALVGYNKADILLFGGFIGICGYLFKTFIIANLFAGTISPHLVTDQPGITVAVVAIVLRLIFGGNLRTGTEIISKGDSLKTTLAVGLGFSIMIAGTYITAISSGVSVDTFGGVYPQLCFGLAAIGLIFAQTGQPFFGCHHIIIMTAEATVQSYNTTGSLAISLIVGIIFGIITAVLGDVFHHLINSGDINHIDEPACAIFLMTFVVNAFFPII